MFEIRILLQRENEIKNDRQWFGRYLVSIHVDDSTRIFAVINYTPQERAERILWHRKVVF